MDFRMINGTEKIKTLSGKKAEITFEKIIKNLREEKQGTKSNQNYHYGDYRISKKKDMYGNPIYIQLKKDFNNETEILGEVETKIYKLNLF